MAERSDREIISLGKSLVYNLFVLIKNSKNYGEGHSAMQTPTNNLLNSVKALTTKNEEASLTLKGGYILLGDQHRLKPDSSGYEAFQFVLGELKRYFIGEITFSPYVRAEDIGKFPYIFGEVEPLPAPQTFEKFMARLSGRNIQGIELDILSEDEEHEDAIIKDSKEGAKKVYSQTLHVASEVMKNVKMGQTLKLRKSKRAIQSMIDQFLTAETNLIGLTTLHCHDEYTYNHSVNVCILSLAIGQRMGLSKASLCDLGMTALFHDLGKADIPLEILNKPSSFTKEEWCIMQKHPVYGVKKLMNLKGLDALGARIVIGAFEHHLNYDLSGYPKVPYKKQLSLFGRIIAIADCYDGLTSSRVYSRVPHTPDEAINFMMARAGMAYDPVLMKLFVNCIGLYPIGSLLLLNTGELGVILESSPDPEKWNTPKVKIIADSSGSEIDGETVDLSDADTGRSIVKTLNAEKHHIDISKYFT